MAIVMFLIVVVDAKSFTDHVFRRDRTLVMCVGIAGVFFWLMFASISNYNTFAEFESYGT